MITGWGNYYKTVCSKETFSKMDFLMYNKLRKWAKRRHPNKNQHWVSDKYWHTQGNRNWAFGEKEVFLREHNKISTQRHIKVQGNRSPYDGDKVYWSTRMGKHPEVRKSIANLLKTQKGKCNHCGLHFLPGEKMEIDHIIPKTKGGDNMKTNLQLLHRHCHDTKTRDDKSLAKGTHKEPDWRGAVCGETRKHGSEDEWLW